MNRELTPYDTGERLEPFPLVSNHRGAPAATDKDAYGKVALEDDESKTEMTVWAQRSETGGYELHVEHAFGEVVPVVQYPDLGRAMQVTSRPLEKDHILGMRETFATAENEGHQIMFAHGFGFGSTSLAIEIEFADGTRGTEIMPFNEILQQWAAGMITDYNWRKKGQEESA